MNNALTPHERAVRDLREAYRELVIAVYEIEFSNDLRANRYNTDDECVLHIWSPRSQQSWDIRYNVKAAEEALAIYLSSPEASPSPQVPAVSVRMPEREKRPEPRRSDAASAEGIKGDTLAPQDSASRPPQEFNPRPGLGPSQYMKLWLEHYGHKRDALADTMASVGIYIPGVMSNYAEYIWQTCHPECCRDKCHMVSPQSSPSRLSARELTFSQTAESDQMSLAEAKGLAPEFAWFDGKYYTLPHPDCVQKLCEAYHLTQSAELRKERKAVAWSAWQVLSALFGIEAKGLYRVCNWFYDASLLDECPKAADLFPLQEHETNLLAKLEAELQKVRRELEQQDAIRERYQHERDDAHDRAEAAEQRLQQIVRALVSQDHCKVCRADRFPHLGDKVLIHRADCAIKEVALPSAPEKSK